MANPYDAVGEGYSPEQFTQWYQQQFGRGPSQDLMNQIGGAVGAPGQNGRYSQAQWDIGQRMAGHEKPIGGTPGAQTPAGAGYTPEQFSSWYSQQFGGQAPSQDLMNQIGAAVGAPAGPNGQYSPEQWAKGQEMAKGAGAPGSPGPGAPGFFPEFTPPEYVSGPAYQPPPAFVAPTMAQAEADPAYQFSLKQGMGALQGRQAAAGLARTGGALKGLMDYGQQAASQQYDKVYDRAAGQYAQNYQMGRDAFGMNEQQRNDRNAWNYKGASDKFNAGFRGRELQFSDLFNRWNTNVNTQTQLALAD